MFEKLLIVGSDGDPIPWIVGREKSFFLLNSKLSDYYWKFFLTCSRTWRKFINTSYAYQLARKNEASQLARKNVKNNEVNVIDKIKKKLASKQYHIVNNLSDISDWN